MTNYKMNFVKSSIYQQEITCSGIKEKEIETIDPEEKKLYERLRKLPEFTTGMWLHHFISSNYDTYFV
jgi:hypothetical protein